MTRIVLPQMCKRYPYLKSDDKLSSGLPFLKIALKDLSSSTRGLRFKYWQVESLNAPPNVYNCCLCIY